MELAQRQKVQVEINKLEKGAICKTSHQKGEFLSNVFSLRKNDGENRLEINLMYMNQFTP